MGPYHQLFAVLVGAAALSIGVPAKACSFSRNAEEKLSDAYAGGIFSGVATVTVADAKYIREAVADAHPWSATATIDAMLMGTYPQKTVTIERGGGSSAGDDDIVDGNSLPKPGEKWIVYFWTSPYHGQIVWISYPFEMAACADRALGPSMKPNPSVRPNTAILLHPLRPGVSGRCRFGSPHH